MDRGTDGRTDTEVGAMDLWSCLERESERERERERERETFSNVGISPLMSKRKT